MISDYEIHDLPHIAALRDQRAQACEAAEIAERNSRSEPLDPEAFAAYVNASQEYFSAALEACDLLERINRSMAEAFGLPQPQVTPASPHV